MAETSASTVVGPSILINGNLQGDEDLTVLGRVEGSITLTKTLHVEESGIIKAEISVRNAVVSGVVVGNITASDSVELTDAGRMVGDIKAPRVIIVDGARFRGTVDMGDLEAPRASGPLPEKKTVALSRPAAARPALPARRPTPVPVSIARSGGGAARTSPVVASSQSRSSESASKSDGAASGGEAGAQTAPVLAGKKLKKKVVVKKKV